MGQNGIPLLEEIGELCDDSAKCSGRKVRSTTGPVVVMGLQGSSVGGGSETETAESNEPLYVLSILGALRADDMVFLAVEGVRVRLRPLDPKKLNGLLSEDDELRVDMELLAVRFLSFCSRSLALRSRCSFLDSLSGSVQTTSHMASS